MEEIIPTPEEVQAVVEVLTADTLTPSPVIEPTEEQIAQINILLVSGMSCVDIFNNCFLPLEWAVKIESQIAKEKSELEALNNPIEEQPIEPIVE